MNEENLGLHASMIEKAPEMLTNCCDKIYFTGTDLELPAQDSALGLTQGRTLFISTESFSTYVIYHELFHAYDNSNGEPSANSLEFINAYEANKQVIPVFAQYSSSFRSEFFAQAGAMYLIMPFELSIAAPETYRYYDEVLGLGKQKEMF
ncbi:MAG: hypothetical protein J6X60_13580 [Ruminiclostridium sp.]|nr:hypothetical protein [Ruminiclostridium sp.]